MPRSASAAWCLNYRARRRRASTDRPSGSAFHSRDSKTRSKTPLHARGVQRSDNTIPFMLLFFFRGKKNWTGRGDYGGPRCRLRVGTLARPRIQRHGMPQTVLGLSGAVVGAFREAVGVFLRGAKFFGYQYFKMSTTRVLATEIDRCECIENTGTTKSVRKKFLNGKRRGVRVVKEFVDTLVPARDEGSLARGFRATRARADSAKTPPGAARERRSAEDMREGGLSRTRAREVRVVASSFTQARSEKKIDQRLLPSGTIW